MITLIKTMARFTCWIMCRFGDDTEKFNAIMLKNSILVAIREYRVHQNEHNFKVAFTMNLDK